MTRTTLAQDDTELKWLASLTSRIGYASGPWLFHVTGEVAAGEIKSRNSSFNTLATFQESNKHMGWTVGVGLEYSWAANRIFGLEYNYFDLGRQQ